MPPELHRGVRVLSRELRADWRLNLLNLFLLLQVFRSWTVGMQRVRHPTSEHPTVKNTFGAVCSASGRLVDNWGRVASLKGDLTKIQI